MSAVELESRRKRRGSAHRVDLGDAQRKPPLAVSLFHEFVDISSERMQGRRAVIVGVDSDEVALDAGLGTVDSDHRLDEKVFVPGLRRAGVRANVKGQRLPSFVPFARFVGRPSSDVEDAAEGETVEPLILLAVVDAVPVLIQRSQNRPFLHDLQERSRQAVDRGVGLGLFTHCSLFKGVI
jgi:hypothetical protein